jgi:hypothetical protein
MRPTGGFFPAGKMRVRRYSGAAGVAFGARLCPRRFATKALMVKAEKARGKLAFGGFEEE